jgi:hypothetical protein
MPYQTFTWNTDITAVDIQTMAEMTLQDYKEYPLATNKVQIKALMEYLKELEQKVGS